MATAIHHGHELRPEVARLSALPDDERLHEEDPFTGEFTAIAPTRIIALRSRFEVDLNRPRDRAVYRRPEDAWGLDLWRSDLGDDLVTRSLAVYDGFYDLMADVLDDTVAEHERFVVFDLHSYNHRRGGPAAPPDPIAGNPEINLGTGSMDREYWGPVVDRFMADLSAIGFLGRNLDVRENVRFRGGHLSRWVHDRYPRTGCALAVEVKKIFMDEWTGQPHPESLAAVTDALGETVPGILDRLGAM